MESVSAVGDGEIAVDAVEHLLRRREVAGGLDHECPVRRWLADVELPIDADVVDAGARASVGEEHDPVVEPDGQAVCHGRRLRREPPLRQR